MTNMSSSEKSSLHPSHSPVTESVSCDAVEGGGGGRGDSNGGGRGDSNGGGRGDSNGGGRGGSNGGGRGGSSSSSMGVSGLLVGAINESNTGSGVECGVGEKRHRIP